MKESDNIIPIPYITPEFKALEAQMGNFSLLEDLKTPLPTNDQFIDQEKFNKSRERYKNQKANSRLGKFKLNKDI